MAVDEILEKQPSESFLYTIDFSDRLTAGDNIASIDALTVAPAGLTLSGQTLSGQTVQFRAAAGATGTLYQITAVVTSVAGDIAEAEARLRVEER